jgi:hypothetical protein
VRDGDILVSRRPPLADHPDRPAHPRRAAPGGRGAFAFVLIGRDGLIVREGETRSERWWQSSDGRHWQSLSSYPPLGATEGVCDSIGCYTRSDGYLLDDGRHLVAVRFSHGAGAWDSTDGRTWQRLALTGDIPGPTSAQQTYASLLPGGLLFFDGTSTWFGEAVVR